MQLSNVQFDMGNMIWAIELTLNVKFVQARKIYLSIFIFLIVKLIGGLVDEKGRWQESVAEFDGQIINVVGDVMISSGVIAYLGSFTVSVTFVGH